MAEEWKFGALNVRFEEPDTLFSFGVGETDGESMRAFNKHCEALAARHGKLYLITDMTRSTGMTPEARKLSTEYSSGNPFNGMVFFGASFTMRTIVNMMVRAGQLLGRNDGAMQFVQNEAEARAWIADLRAKAKSS